ncbi:unnamed protein product [Didymodactylos carnosus]|uniref:Uncharacterized protein n=1 Tax=Didymodactylos carnosus TaxID=1234261 RepID=A0A815JX34_9BILA|nr:unnamed protein product [Didymodactylos carnosus]CAF4277486.1 unnamed protein product [Didymodactylos carnosus]
MEKLNILETKVYNLEHQLEFTTEKLNSLNESIINLKIKNDNINSIMLNNDIDLNELITIKFIHFEEILIESEFNKTKNIKNYELEKTINWKKFDLNREKK